MKETDWKVFKKIKVQALDAYCRNSLRQFEGVIQDKQGTAHERYLHLYDLVQQRNELMAKMFDGHSRSGAILQLMFIRREGLADEALLKDLSEECLQQTDPGLID